VSSSSKPLSILYLSIILFLLFSISHQKFLGVLVIFMFININVVRWILVLVSVFLWVILLLRKGTSVIIPLLEKCLYLWMLPSLNRKLIPRGASNTSLQGEIGSKEEEKLSWDEMIIPIVFRVEITPPTPSKLPEERELRVLPKYQPKRGGDLG
jgi:hypothetical protein